MCSSDLLTWKDKKRTGTIFLAGNLFFLGLCYYSLVSLVSLFTLFICVGGIALNLFIGLAKG